MGATGEAIIRDLNQLHDKKRDLIRNSREVTTSAQGKAAEVLDILGDASPIVRDICTKAVRSYMSLFDEGEKAGIARTRITRGLEQYERIRPEVMPIAGKITGDVHYGSHRTIVYWEMVRFCSHVVEQNLDPRTAYFEEYIKPLMVRFQELRQNLVTDPTSVLRAWEQKITALRISGVKENFLQVNEALLADYRNGLMVGDETAIILSMPYMARSFLPWRDGLSDWVAGETGDESGLFYHAVQCVLAAEALKRRARRIQSGSPLVC